MQRGSRSNRSSGFIESDYITTISIYFLDLAIQIIQYINEQALGQFVKSGIIIKIKIALKNYKEAYSWNF